MRRPPAAGLLTRLAAMLRRLAATLERAARPRKAADVRALAARFPGAPDHWLAYIADRAPHLAQASDPGGADDAMGTAERGRVAEVRSAPPPPVDAVADAPRRSGRPAFRPAGEPAAADSGARPGARERPRLRFRTEAEERAGAREPEGAPFGERATPERGGRAPIAGLRTLGDGSRPRRRWSRVAPPVAVGGVPPDAPAVPPHAPDTAGARSETTALEPLDPQRARRARAARSSTPGPTAPPAEPSRPPVEGREGRDGAFMAWAARPAASRTAARGGERPADAHADAHSVALPTRPRDAALRTEEDGVAPAWPSLPPPAATAPPIDVPPPDLEALRHEQEDGRWSE